MRQRGVWQKKLRHLGRKLLKGSSVHKLMQLLHKLELVLSTVDQEPSKPIQESLVPSMKALISDELLRHTDENVKILVISCLSEITRITAPDAPYDDEQMKEIFKLTVASFEKLSHISGCGYEKALTILDNVNKVRLCLVMLDLECNDLVIEMFQHFLRFIRSNHPCHAFHSMESIMTLILQESEQISPDLLRPLLDSVGNENQTISPMSWTLGEKVIRNCTAKLKPYLMKAVESSGRALNEYAQIVTDICQNESESPQRDDANGSKKTVAQEAGNKLNIPKEAKEQPYDETEGHEPDDSSKRDVQILDDTKSNRRDTMDEVIKKTGSKRRSRSEITKKSERGSAKAKLETDNVESVQEPKSETQLNTVSRKRGRKPNSLMNAEEGYDHSWIYRETEVEKSTLSRKTRESKSPFPSSEKPTSRKDKLHQKPKSVSETLVCKPKSENIAKPAKSRRTHNIGNDTIFPEFTLFILLSRSKMDYRWTNGRQETGGRDRRPSKREQAYQDSVVENLSQDFRLPINHRPTENVDLDNVEQASLDTQLTSSNIGFKLLQKMGWKGKGLGKDEQGITEPIKSGIRDPRLGVGKQEEDDFFTAEENIQRKKLDVELEETEEHVKKREVLAEREQKIQTEVKEIRKVFYCDLCNKQYKLAMEFEAHLSSYDHNHRKRFKQMKEMHGGSSRDDRQKREEQRQEREMAKFAQIADAQKQQRLQLQQESGSGTASSESRTATALTDQEQRNTLKFGFSSKGSASKITVGAKKQNVAKKPSVPISSIFSNDSDEE